MFINALYQKIAQQTLTPLQPTIIQEIIIVPDQAVHYLIIACMISSVWTILIQYGVNNQHLFGHHRYIHYESNRCMLWIFVSILCVVCGVLLVLGFFVRVNFVEIVYDDDWSVYTVIFSDDN